MDALLMELAGFITKTVRRTRGLPTPIRYAGTAAVVLVALLLRLTLQPLLPPGYPFSFFYAAILISATLFDRGSGLVATGLSAFAASYFFLPPYADFLVGDIGHLLALLLFVAIGVTISVVLESLHRSLADLQRANEGLEAAHAETAAALRDAARAERGRALLLREFRHRTRNDLGSLAGLLMLRARTASSEATREGLREAAQHALALGRVHNRLSAADKGAGEDEVGVVDTHAFIEGLCADLDVAQLGEGLRAVALVPEAESHLLDNERAVPLGLVLNETLTNALKYAFPEERPGTVRVRFLREGPNFLLMVADDGVGLPPEGDLEEAPPGPVAQGAGLGTRLLRALAAQLRGQFDRRPGPNGVGTVAELRFPVRAPGASAG